ncbi:MAG: anaerobic ribonucleoside-triphosphate reductase activating protein [Methanoregulaceae archaeon]|nr:anaerobic ribonucleoside-triphosphate reductase activating protein [Methanoregulaceae archaeon]
MKVNYGGFVPLSTVDWRGRAVCTVFLRGCPLRCSYCHNAAIQTGEDIRDTGEIIALIESARSLISGVVFSGGEPTLQKNALIGLASAAKEKGLLVGLQTNGYFPETLESLIERRLVDRIALDFKTRWEGYSRRLEGYGAVPRETYNSRVRQSILLCRDALRKGSLADFEIVATIFPGNEGEVPGISKMADGVDLVLQQGELKRYWGDWILSPDAGAKKSPVGLEKSSPSRPLTAEELREVADTLGRTVRIRTREGGEEVYEGHRRRRAACQR